MIGVAYFCARQLHWKTRRQDICPSIPLKFKMDNRSKPVAAQQRLPMPAKKLPSEKESTYQTENKQQEASVLSYPSFVQNDLTRYRNKLLRTIRQEETYAPELPTAFKQPHPLPRMRRRESLLEIPKSSKSGTLDAWIPSRQGAESECNQRREPPRRPIVVHRNVRGL
jgi:hypothetical protein